MTRRPQLPKGLPFASLFIGGLLCALALTMAASIAIIRWRADAVIEEDHARRVDVMNRLARNAVEDGLRQSQRALWRAAIFLQRAEPPDYEAELNTLVQRREGGFSFAFIAIKNREGLLAHVRDPLTDLTEEWIDRLPSDPRTKAAWHIMEQDDQVALVYSLPLYDMRGGRQTGLLHGGIQLRGNTSFLSRLCRTAGAQGYALLFDGRLIASFLEKGGELQETPSDEPSGKSRPGPGGYPLISAGQPFPIVQDDRLRLVAYDSASPMLAMRRALRTDQLLLLFCVLAAALVAALVFARFVTLPVKRLMLFAAHASASHAVEKPPPSRIRELDQLAALLRHTLAQLHDRESHLRLERERLAGIIYGTHTGTWEWNIQTGEILINERWADIAGYSLEELSPASIETWAKLCHPEDLELSEALLEKHFRGDLPYYECEVRMRHKSGEWVWVLDRGRVVSWSHDGKPLMMMGTHQDITERKQAEAALQAERDQLLSVFNSVGEAIYIADVQTYELLYVNPHLAGMLPGDCIGKKCHQVLQGLDEPCAFCTNEIIMNQQPEPYRWHYHNTKLNRHFAIMDRIIRWSDGREVRFEMAVDITAIKQAEKEREKLHAQLMQSQKLESIGRLAGGVAHDFNNMLGVILGHVELLLEGLAPDNPVHGDLKEIQTAAKRSSDLTRQLLAFARKQTVEPEVLQLNETVSGMLKMLGRLIGEDIDLAWKPAPGLWPVKLDPAQVDQILVNLCVNARDAIGGAGKLTIETGNAVFDQDYCAHHADFIPGDYVLLAVSDDGCGMDAWTRANVFEPFFTTKQVGGGTGLGLATVYGVVKQNRGFVHVYSEPGQGTTFRIYLPRHAGAPREKTDSKPPPMADGSGTILLVEDDPPVMRMAATMLQRLGYQVVAACHPDEALRLAREHAGRIDLLLTDVVMPEMNGRDLAQNLLALDPRMKCLFMSGYTANVIAHHGVLDEGVHFIQKPFSKSDLDAKLKMALETSG